MRHDVIWTQISVGMKEFNHELNWKQCKSHMSSLKKKFNEEYKDTKKTGAAPSTWEHFAAMLEILWRYSYSRCTLLSECRDGLDLTSNG